MERKLVFSKNGNIYLDTYMTQSAFSKSRLSLRLTENGFIATKKDNEWTFTNWFFTGTKLDEATESKPESVLLEGAGFSGLTLKDFFETQDNTRQYFASALVCSAIESAIKQNVPLYAIGAGGIVISSEFERIIFVPFDLYETASQCAGTEMYAKSEGMYINKNLKKYDALRFTQAIITYKVLTGELPYTQQDEILREEDYKDHNYIPVAQKVWSLNQNLAQIVDSALQTKPSQIKSPQTVHKPEPFPIEELFKELGITPEGHPAAVIRKTTISNEKFKEEAEKKQKSFQKSLKIKRWVRHNKTAIGIAGAVMAIVIAVAGTLTHGMMQQPTTKGLSSFETIEMFYSAVNNTDTVSAKSSSNCKNANTLIDILSTIYVASKTRNAYNFKDKTVSPAEWFQFNYDGSYTMYGLTQFSIETEKGSLFYTAPAKNTYPKPITIENPDIKDKSKEKHTVSYYLVYNEGDGSLFAEEKEDTVTLTFTKNKWIITDIQQKTIRESKINYKAFVEEYKAALEQEGNDILKTAKELRKHYYWIPSNSELLEADNKIKAQNGSF